MLISRSNEENKRPFTSDKVYESIFDIRGEKSDGSCLPGQRPCKRKFPGPAGILPPPLANRDLNEAPEIVQKAEKNKKPKNNNESQSVVSDDIFTTEVWTLLVDDMGPQATSVLEKFSIRSSLLKASRKLLHRGKIPLIIGVIEHLDIQGSDFSCVIRDPTGRVKGSLHQDTMKEPELAPQIGSVVILRQVSVISPSPRTHYLNVTPGNIVLVYTTNRKAEITKHSLSTPNHSIPSLIDIIKESEFESNLSLQYSRENLSKLQPPYLTSPRSLFSSPQVISAQTIDSISINSVSVNKVYTFRNIPQHLITPNSLKTSTIIQQRNRGDQKHFPSRSCDRVNVTSSSSYSHQLYTSVNGNKLTQKVSSPAQVPSALNEREHSMFLLDDDDEFLQLCDAVSPDSTSEHSATVGSNDPLCDQMSAKLKETTGTTYSQTGTSCKNSPEIMSEERNVKKSELILCSNPLVQLSDQLTANKIIFTNPEDVERDSSVQLKHSGPILETSQKFSHWEDDLNSEIILSQLSEEF